MRCLRIPCIYAWGVSNAINEYHKAKLSVPHIPELEVITNDYTIERTQVYAKYNTTAKSKNEKTKIIKNILDQYEKDNEYAGKYHYEKNGHTGKYYKFNEKIWSILDKQVNQIEQVKVLN